MTPGATYFEALVGGTDPALVSEAADRAAHLRQVRWMLEEYRVSLWAQQLGTPYPVSDQRIRRSLAP